MKVMDRRKINQEEIENLLWDLCIPFHLKGFRELCYAIWLVIQNEDLLYQVTKNLYPLVALEFNTKWNCVEHNMRTAISNCWEKGGKSMLLSIARRDLPAKPTTVEFISIVANYLIRR